MGAFWDIIQTELDRERFDVSDRKLARKLGVSPTTIANWRAGIRELPEVENLKAVADFSGRSYEDVLIAALADTGHAEGTRFASNRRDVYRRNTSGPEREKLSDDEYARVLDMRDRAARGLSGPDESVDLAALDVEPLVDQEAGESTEG